MIGVRRRGTDFGAGGERRRSDAAGLVSFVDLAVGWMQVTSDRFGMRYAEIRAGQTTELEFVLEAGVLLTGLVVDATGTPVAGASVDVLTPASSEYYEVLAVSGADGRFAVRGAPSLLFVGARAMGHGASPSSSSRAHPATGSRCACSSPRSVVRSTVSSSTNRAARSACAGLHRGRGSARPRGAERRGADPAGAGAQR
jgi:hypothetical protein